MMKYVSISKKYAVRLVMAVCTAMAFLMLSGCLYPQEEHKENQIASREYVVVVQSAIDQYRKDTGVLPIKNSEMDTPIYEKYIIDFKKLKEMNDISDIPVNAFEKGGTAYYVLVNVEQHAEVKLMDLISYLQVKDVQKEVDDYIHDNQGKLPAGQMVAPHFYYLDFDKLGTKTVQIKSVYSQQYLSLLLTDKGQAVIDYSPEIMKALQKKGIGSPDPKNDLRSVLVDSSYFVPVGSYPYYWKNGQPVIAEK